MTKLLVVETSPRIAHSVSRHLTRRFVSHWADAHATGSVTTRDLATTDLPFVSESWLQASLSPAAERTPDMQDLLSFSDLLVAELLAADEIVIATPVYNYNVPAALKAWIDHIVRKGLTLGLDGKGLLVGKKATVLIASGGVYAEGSPIQDRDIASRYLRLILHVIGIDDVTVVAGGGAKAVDLGETTMDAFVNALEKELGRAAGSAN